MGDLFAITVFQDFHKLGKYPHMSSGGDSKKTVPPPPFTPLDAFEKKSRAIVFIDSS